MNRILIFGILILIEVFASPLPEEKSSRFIQFADDNGVLHWIDLEDDNLPTHKFDPDQDIKYLIYNRENPERPVEFIKGDNESLFATHFDPSKPVKISIHGWGGGAGTGNNIGLANAFLSAMDVSVIVIDWSVGASADYIRACIYVPQVGAKVGEMIDWFNELGVPFTNFHVMGFSLGGHVAGVTGRTPTRGVVEYITGLDPAGPLWGSDSQRLRPSDGKYVEVIHTNAGELGLTEPVGHTDFYPNGGRLMPGCAVLDPGCSHGRSHQYLADSIDHQGFMADRCNGVDEIRNHSCANIGKLYMGGSTIKPGYEGVYYLETNANKPYYKG